MMVDIFQAAFVVGSAVLFISYVTPTPKCVRQYAKQYATFRTIAGNVFTAVSFVIALILWFLS
jgi:hypothetical protein